MGKETFAAILQQTKEQNIAIFQVVEDNYVVLKWSMFRRAEDVEPKQEEGPLDLFVSSVYKGLLYQQKNTHCLCGSIFRGNRTKENVIESHLLGFDFDASDIEELERIYHQFLPGKVIVIHSSPSDGLDAAVYKYRVWVPLAVPLKKKDDNFLEFSLLWEFLADSFSHLGLIPDRVCKDPSRIFYTPRTFAEAQRKPFILVRPGRCFFDPRTEPITLAMRRHPDVIKEGRLQELVSAYEQEEQQYQEEQQKKRQERLEAYRSSSKRFGLEERTQRSLIHMVEVMADTLAATGEGSRNQKLNDCVYTLAGYIESGLLDESLIVEMMESAALSAGLTKKETDNTIASAISGGKKKPFTREEILANRHAWEQEHPLPPRIKPSVSKPMSAPSQQQTDSVRLERVKENWEKDQEDQEEEEEDKDQNQEEEEEEESPQTEAGEGQPPAKPPTPTDGSSNNMREDLCLMGDFREKAEQLLKAIHRLNHPPTIFSVMDNFGFISQRGIPGSLGATYGQASVFESGDAFLFHCLDYVKLFRFDAKSGDIVPDNNPSQRFFTALVNNTNLVSRFQFPVLDGVYRCPFVLPNQKGLALERGYYPDANLYLESSYPIAVPERPKEDDMVGAIDFIMTELLGDFPFQDQSSRIHALCMMLLPFVRPLILGPTPLHIIMAPESGTGKTLLAKVVSLAVYGLPAYIIEEQQSDEEWGKKITSTLISDDANFVVIDNLNKYLDSANIAKLLTDTRWRGRMLGQSRNVDKKNIAVWVATGNNPKMTKEIERRCLFIRLNAEVARPEERTQFRHTNLEKWTLENRQELLKAAMTVLQYWIAQGGKHQRERVLGSFEGWSEVMGGVMQSCGLFEHFLANKQMYSQDLDTVTVEWTTFFDIVHSHAGDDWLKSTDMYRMLLNPEIVPEDVLGYYRGPESHYNKDLNRFSQALIKMKDRVFGSLKLNHKHSKGVTYYSLTKVKSK